MRKNQMDSGSISTLAQKYQCILREQVIDEHGPGTILQDFAILLDFIETQTPPVSKTNNLLTMKELWRLNEQLTHPLAIDLKRPQQKSYPHINGLYLLLRSSGLGLIEGGGTKLHIALDPQLLESWRSLNPTEQYCTLLETWVMRNTPEAIGESSGGLFGRSPLFTWKPFFERFYGQEMQVAGDKNQEQHLAYYPGMNILALLELFGFVTIQHGKPDPGKGWKILSIVKTSFGEAILQLLANSQTRISMNDMIETILSYEDIPLDDMLFGELQGKFQKFFPDWQRNLCLPEREIQEGTYIFRVSLGRVWRRIAIPGTMVLDRLSDVILNAFQFDHDHLYSFIFKGPTGREIHVNHPYVEEPPFTDEVLVQDVPLHIGGSMIFLFDFGDNWQFDVQLERIDPVDPKLEKTKVLEKKGKAPEQYPSWDEEW